jgi:predicted GNAT family acetyltransferase
LHLIFNSKLIIVPADVFNTDVVHNQDNNRFEVDLGSDKAVLVYMIKEGFFILLHTEVPPAFEGRGIAGRMAKAALEYAKKEGYKVMSYCSYTTMYIQRHPEYKEMMG